MADDNTVTLVRLILAIILPPLGVFLKHGLKVRPRSAACLPVASSTSDVSSS
jgi:hypothetical protein